MQKVDVVIAIVGAIAIVATTLGVVFYEEIAGEETLEFESITDEGLYEHTFSGVGSGTHEWSFEVPDNATAADFMITVTFVGQTGQGASPSISASFTDPTGNRSNEDSQTMVLGANVNSGSVTLDLTRMWATMPEGGNHTDIDAAAQAAITSYEGQVITVTVVIGSVNDPLVGVPGLGVNYTYDIDIAGDLTRYQRAADPIPDPIGGQ